MKTVIMLSAILGWAFCNAQAATITLKDGHAVQGNIIKQDKTHVVVSVEGSELTYYSDEITSIQPDPGEDLEKEKLVGELMSYFPSTVEVATKGLRMTPRSKDSFKAFLKNDSAVLRKLNLLRIQGHMKYFSTTAMKARIDYYSSPAGKEYNEDFRMYQHNSMVEFSKILSDELFKWRPKNRLNPKPDN